MRNACIRNDQQLGALEKMPHLREHQVAAEARKNPGGIDRVEQVCFARPRAQHDT